MPIRRATFANLFLLLASSIVGDGHDHVVVRDSVAQRIGTIRGGGGDRDGGGDGGDEDDDSRRIQVTWALHVIVDTYAPTRTPTSSAVTNAAPDNDGSMKPTSSANSKRTYSRRPTPMRTSSPTSLSMSMAFGGIGDIATNETVASSTESELYDVTSFEAIMQSQQSNITGTTDRIEPPSTLLLRIESASYSDYMGCPYFAAGSSPDATTGASDEHRRREQRNSLPNPRDVSNAFHADGSIINTHGASDWMWAFGQFLTHDLSDVNVTDDRSCDIPISSHDPYLHNITSIPMSRSKSRLDSRNVSQQLSDMTPTIDAENVYGTTSSRLDYIRSDDSAITGRLRTSGEKNLLPKNVMNLTNGGGDDRDDFFLAGDHRANQNLPLLATHTLWVREHNYWADTIGEYMPDLDGDDIFEVARVMVRAIMQKIVYDEYLPSLLGEGSIPEYDGYKEDANTGLENVVSSCALRIGHTLVGQYVTKDYGKGDVAHLSHLESFFAPDQIETYGLDPFLRGLATNKCDEIDPYIVPDLRNHLFLDKFDLLSLNIGRARDHGIPDFNTIRESLGYPRLDSFDDFLFGRELASVYGDTGQIDCWVGMNAEPRVEGLMVGPTQRAILARNFANIRDGDAYFYRNLLRDPELLRAIEATTFADVIRRNSDSPHSLDDIRGNVFFVR
ncbi:hypothetical protein ACHAXA_010321 [Cyclostephanos tholiformis]|uniref:Peroxinectin n=1 Tax=Cyclostephanos tholiformis TaxID=382380 RepID=A0ABD3RF40_9STRA